MIIEKICSKCGKSKVLGEFHKRIDGIHGRRSDCIECRKPIKKEYYEENKELLIKQSSESRDRIKMGLRREKISEEKQRKKRREYISNYHKRKRKEDLNFKLSYTIRNFLKRCLSGSNNTKLLGYGTSDLIKRIEVNFKKGMSWDNYGEKWVIDHKKPIHIFLKQGIYDPRIINSLCNLQPMWKLENLIKGGRFYHV